MKCDPEKHHRKSIRLKGYDYSLPGAYFVTLVVNGRLCIFGEISDGEIHLNKFGRIVLKTWTDLPRHYPNVELGTFCVMPNHFHGIVILKEQRISPKRHPLSEIIRGFKSFSARQINALQNSPGTQVWQRNYYDRIIRDEAEFNAIHLYIESNPANWLGDNEYPTKTTRME